MSITFDEAFEFRDIQSTETEYTIEATFIIVADTPAELLDEAAARTFIIEFLPLVIDGLARSSIETIERVNDRVYRTRLLYESAGPLDEEDEEIIEGSTDTFDTTGGTEHISYGISRVEAAGNPSAQLGAAINYDGENVNGVDITVPKYGFTKKIKIPDSFVTSAFKQNLFKATGKTNSLSFEFFAENEILFLGAQGSKVTTFDDIEDEWEITYHFQGQVGRFGIKFNEGQTDEFFIDKQGWDYIWVQYENKEDVDQSQIVKKALAAYVIRVYDQIEFQLLGIGSF